MCKSMVYKEKKRAKALEKKRKEKKRKIAMSHNAKLEREITSQIKEYHYFTIFHTLALT